MWERTWRDLLREVVEGGSRVDRKDEKRNNMELVSHKFAIADPRDRLICSTSRPINIFQCVGHFLWITQSNFQVDAISYYQPIARKFSSDDIRLIGAYGPRLFGIGHMNQIKYILDTLDEDPGKRKAVASIYLPHFDQHGLPKEEVPCTLNLQYLVRDDNLLGLTYMRSQDAFKVLPYDVFIFTMLQEYVQNNLVLKHGLKLGSYHHYSGSFHVYDEDLGRISNVLDECDSGNLSMPPMPPNDPEIQLGKMNEFETIVRTNVVAQDKHRKGIDFESMFGMAEEILQNDYWRQIGYLLLCYGAHKLKDNKHQEAARAHLCAPYGDLVDMWLKTGI